MAKLVECVPNFSEGRDLKKIQAIVAPIETVPGVKLLDVDPGADTNRTVVTMVGPPDAVVEAAFLAIEKASELIDMRHHSGAHARMGATDVCPFVPISEMTDEECVELCHELGKRVAEELSIPVYLYEKAAQKPDRRNLAVIREGQYEGFAEKIKDPHWAPDYGEPVFNAKSGATNIGVREFLIAYNINLNTKNVKRGRSIAFDIREKGRTKKKKDGTVEQIPGLFQHCKSTAWFLPEHGVTQITMNLTDYKVTPPHVVFEKVRELARDKDLRVMGSELVGLIPKAAMLEAGYYYLDKQGASRAIAEREVIKMAVDSMGLDTMTEFDIDKKVIEYAVLQPGPLVSMSVTAFAEELASDSPAPGGGSVAALSGSLAASLSAMVAELTYWKKGFKKVQPKMSELGQRAQQLKDRCLAIIDEDTDAFNRVMDAMKLPKGTDEEADARDAAILRANREATEVPFGLLTLCPEIIDIAGQMIADGNPNSVSDAGVANMMGLAAAEGAYYNVLINLQGFADEAYVRDMRSRAEELLVTCRAAVDANREALVAKL